MYKATHPKRVDVSISFYNWYTIIHVMCARGSDLLYQIMLRANSNSVKLKSYNSVQIANKTQYPANHIFALEASQLHRDFSP